MRIKLACMILVMLVTFGGAYAAGGGVPDIRTARPGATVSVDRVIKEGKVVVTVSGADSEPLLGLGATDFSLVKDGRVAQITSVKPISESLDVPRHFVLVLDNSYSMQERNAVSALLNGVGNLLKIVRPIDRVSMVTFDDKLTVNASGRTLRVQTLTSSQQDELMAYARQAYGKGLTSRTVLYEGIMAGLDLVGKAPESEPRFMVIFSDGEDLNSSVKSQDVVTAAATVGKFNVYAIDYMPGSSVNKFLLEFASRNNGKTWKAQSESNLVPIFESVASKMQYYYVLDYRFPTTGTLAVSPQLLTVDEVATAVTDRRIDSGTLVVRPVLDTAYGIARWKITASNSRGSVTEQAGEGNPAAEITLPLPTGDLPALVAGGDLAVKMELQDKSGQDLVLTAPPVRFKVMQTRASLAVDPATVTIEEIKTIDSSPMLGQIFFVKGASDIPVQYIRFGKPEETAGFDEQKFRDTLEKYYQLLNIIGKRLSDNAAATITLVGCNDNTGEEKGKKKLSAQRAEAVKNYFQTVWGIAPERMKIEARNLPAMQSSSRTMEGQAENRRVEIVASDPAILMPIRSTYFSTRTSSDVLTLRPDVTVPYGIADWRISVTNGGGSIADIAGKGAPDKEIRIPLGKDLKALGTAGDITVKMDIRDQKGQAMALAVPVKVEFVETSKRAAEKRDQKVQEKYALILFDFDKDALSPSNQMLVNKIVDRFRTLPQATLSIVGHTDNIGKEAYNMKLSERRAAAVNTMVASAYGEPAGERIHFSGVGPNSPLFDNSLPELRSFNRTVTITLEYTSTE